MEGNGKLDDLAFWASLLLIAIIVVAGLLSKGC